MEAADIKDLMARSLDDKLSASESVQLSALLRAQPRLSEELERMAFARVEGASDTALDSALKSARKARPAAPANTAEIETAILSKAKRGRLLSMRNVAWFSGATAAAAAVVIVFTMSGNPANTTNSEGGNGGANGYAANGNNAPKQDVETPHDDRSLSKEEREKIFMDRDKNGDLKLTGDEILGNTTEQQVFRGRFDDNDDKAVSYTEYMRPRSERDAARIHSKEKIRPIEADWTSHFNKNRKNKDDILDRNEAGDKFMADFDADKDGAVTKDEYVRVTLAQGLALEFLGKFDDDKNGCVERAELEGRDDMRKLWEADADGDRKLSHKELEVFALNHEKIFLGWLNAAARRANGKPANK